ncbi:MAG: class A beta-lactamase [Bacteroides sp.]|nr:class A beta-lactamase [Bacteroides sp.]MCM1085247.1 class A beta-lactamase [Bacteroides sp.]
MKLVRDVPARVGIAVITPDNDTLTVNNSADYPLMSVFKLHEALAVAHVLDLKGMSLDTELHLDRRDLNPDTWSPMLKEHREPVLRLTVGQLLEYALQQSDNNASNVLFDSIVSVRETDRFIREATGISDFKLTHTEAEMHRDHALAGQNCGSPLSCARLIRQVFTDSLVSSVKQEALRRMLCEVSTGADRIYVSVADKPEVRQAHKTGSGFRTPDGLLGAHNDVGYIMMPDGTAYALAVLVKDFPGTEAQASALIACIANIVYNHLYAHNQ